MSVLSPTIARRDAEPALSPEERAYAAERRRTRAIRFCIWAYIVLWILEGALRKWVFPGLANPLGMIREPFVAAAYLLAFRAGVFPRNFIVWVSAILCFVLILIGYFLIGLPIGVMAAGVWAYFWPIPFIFLIPRVMDQSDVHRVAKFLMLVAIPMALLMAVQFKSPAGSKINAIVGQEEYVESWSTKEVAGEVRPSGTWSYVGGASSFYMLVAGVVLAYLTERRRASASLWVASLVSVLLSTLVSHSRTQVWGIAFVLGLYILFGLRVLSGRLNRLVLGVLLIAVAAVALLSTKLGQEGIDVLEHRFTSAAKVESFTDRMLYTFVPPDPASVPLGGFGLGVGTNTGALFLVGRRAFLLAENEPPRVMMEFGYALGIIYLLFVRFGIVALMAAVAWRQSQLGNLLPVGILAAGAFMLVAGTWGTPPIQAFAVLCAGLCLAAARQLPCRSGTRRLRQDLPA
ncbi:MAG TPA: hypothetical protein DER07_03065 [Armatimonadetes bacterium]|nr:hypothetical protein [Armatimonadota bacterium]